MSMVCFGSVRGAPGASTLAVLAAACWPRPVALLEADPAGGALAVRYRLGRTPGLSGLAAMVRHGADEEALWQHAQMLPGDLPVVVAPESGEVTTGILRDAGPALALWCNALANVDIIVDCGRIALRDVNWPLCAGADETIVVARPRAEELYPAAHRLRAMIDDVPSAGLVLVGDRPHSPSEVTAQLGVPVRGVVADDSWAAGVLTVGGRSRGLRRSSLVRSVRSLVDDLMYRLETPAVESGPQPAGALPSPTMELPAGMAARNSGRVRVATPTARPPNVRPTMPPANHTPPPPTREPVAVGARTTSSNGIPPIYAQRTRDATQRTRANPAPSTGSSRRFPYSGEYPKVEVDIPAEPHPPPGPPRREPRPPVPPRPGRKRPSRPGMPRWGRRS